MSLVVNTLEPQPFRSAGSTEPWTGQCAQESQAVAVLLEVVE